jgi:hypothetical protein
MVMNRKELSECASCEAPKPNSIPKTEVTAIPLFGAGNSTIPAKESAAPFFKPSSA